MSLSPGTRLGPYEVMAAIGAGGMGEVYKANDKRLERTVAIKVLPPDIAGDAERRQRFEREARTISRLNHPNICTLYDIGEYEGQPFIVMEVISGVTIQQRLRRQPFKVADVLELSSQLADALDAAHAEGIIHRDIKPANIFVTDRGQAKLLDFGLAKLVTDRRSGSHAERAFEAPTLEPEHLTQPGSALGTVAYMSPEQARGEALDRRTDVFSLGSVMYEMVTGRQAFSGPTSAVVFDQILNRVPVAPVRLSPDVPPRLEAIINNALEKDRELRYQNAADLRADLKRAKRDIESGRSSVTSAAAVAPSSGPLSVTQSRAPVPDSVAAEVSPGSRSAPSHQTPVSQATASSSAPARRQLGLVIVGVGAVALLLLVVLLGSRSGNQGGQAGGDVSALSDALVQSQVALATSNLSARNYEGAVASAEAILMAVPDHAGAIRIRDEARAALEEVATLLGEARQALETDQRVQAREAVAAALAISPAAPEANALARELNRDTAASQDPRPPEVTSTPAVNAPQDAARRATTPVEPPEPSVPARTDQPAIEEPPTPEPAVTEPAVSPVAPPEPAVVEPTPAERPAPEEPPLDPPAAAPEAAPRPAVDEEAAIRTVLATYARAIEGQDMALFQSVWPGLSAEQETQLQASFESVPSQSVDLTLTAIDMQGDRAVVRITRRDTIVINGGQQTSESEQSITLTKAAGGWVIVEIGQ